MALAALGKTPLGILVRYRVSLGFALAALYLWAARPDRSSLLLGMIPLLPGLALRTWASGSIRKGEKLAVTGPYSLVRNPLYAGSFLIGLGICLMGNIPWAVLLFVLLFVLVYRRKMRDEEAHLEKLYGEEYREYRSRVPRLLPRLGRVEPGGFSWRLLVEHREYELWLGVAAAVGILWAKAVLAP